MKLIKLNKLYYQGNEKWTKGPEIYINIDSIAAVVPFAGNPDENESMGNSGKYAEIILSNSRYSFDVFQNMSEVVAMIQLQAGSHFSLVDVDALSEEN